MNKSVASEYIWNPRICLDMLAFKLIFESLKFGEQNWGILRYYYLPTTREWAVIAPALIIGFIGRLEPS